MRSIAKPWVARAFSRNVRVVERTNPIGRSEAYRGFERALRAPFIRDSSIGPLISQQISLAAVQALSCQEGSEFLQSVLERLITQRAPQPASVGTRATEAPQVCPCRATDSTR